jgi:hypothetical protein
MSNRRRPFQLLGAAALTTFIGGSAFSDVAGNPRFETYHVLDVIRLMTAGAAVAVTIMLLIKFFNRGPHSEDIGAGEKSSEEST